MTYSIAGVTIELILGNITDQHADAIVNAANAKLEPGGGVAGAIHRKAGPQLYEYCRPLAPIKPGQAVITPGANLPGPHVIHCLGPVYGRDEPSDQLLADCYKNALSLAQKHNLKTIAFPAISTGAFGYPWKQASAIVIDTVVGIAPELTTIQTIRFVFTDEQLLSIYDQLLTSHLQ